MFYHSGDDSLLYVMTGDSVCDESSMHIIYLIKMFCMTALTVNFYLLLALRMTPDSTNYLVEWSQSWGALGILLGYNCFCYYLAYVSSGKLGDHCYF